MTLCYYCKQPLTRGGTQKQRSRTSDHRIPKSRGGGGGDNKVPCCFQCNQRKGDMTEDEFRASNGISREALAWATDEAEMIEEWKSANPDWESRLRPRS